MRFAKRSKSHVQFETIALADIVMNLFLFFFISFSLLSTFNHRRESPLKVNLPALAKGVQVVPARSHEILIAKNGSIQWNDSAVTLRELKQKLEDKKTRTEKVALRSDRDASVQSLVRVLETIRDSGAVNVTLQTEIESQRSIEAKRQT